MRLVGIRTSTVNPYVHTLIQRIFDSGKSGDDALEENEPQVNELNL